MSTVGGTNAEGHAAVQNSVAKVALSASSKVFLVVLVLFGAALSAATNYWSYLGYPALSAVADWSGAKSECVNLAQENKTDLLPDGVGNIKAESQWIRKGKNVVELSLRKYESDKSFSSRLCVVGDGSVEIVPALSQETWK